MPERGGEARTLASVPVRHIAVFIQNRARFGTLVCHIPLIDALRRRYPAARLTVVAPFAEARLLVGDGLADALSDWPKGPWAQWRLVRALTPDLAISLRPASMFIDLLIGVSGAPIRLGFATGISRRLFTAVAPRDLGVYRPLNYLRLVEPLGVRGELSAYLDDLGRRAAPAVDPSAENVCLMPGGASPFKLWGIDNFLALADLIRGDRPGARFFFVLGPDERPLRAAIDASPLGEVSQVLDTPSLGAIAQAVRASWVTIANDCGPSHVAQLLGCPYVAVYANHRGQAERITAQWFRPGPRARWVSAPAGAPITDVSPDQVYRGVRAVLAVAS